MVSENFFCFVTEGNPLTSPQKETGEKLISIIHHCPTAAQTQLLSLPYLLILPLLQALLHS